MSRRAIAVILLLLALFVPRSDRCAAEAGAFEPHWQDGRAELDGYRYEITRYGERRSGTCVMIYVTEPFSERKRVKVDDPSRNPADTFEALKLNIIRDFQTGIYDYNTMVSLFTRSRDFTPVKATFSSAEWCGHLFEEVLPRGSTLSIRLDSYFEDESSERTLPMGRGAILEDNLFILLRGLRHPYLKPGEKRAVTLLPGALYRRLIHRTPSWERATIERLARTERVRVPAGEFETDVYVVGIGDAREGRFHVEHAYPHRVIRWTWASTTPRDRRGRNAEEGLDRGELAGSLREPYWRENGNEFEGRLRALGLRAAR